jgi:hypothetical protein
VFGIFAITKAPSAKAAKINTARNQCSTTNSGW